jgi:DNA-binding NarL/FixJ family response regulator
MARALVNRKGVRPGATESSARGPDRKEYEVAKKIFILEDHPVFREGLVQLISREEGLAVCGQAADAETALREVPKLKPDLALVDISLPGKNGLEFIKELRTVNREIKLLVVSMHDKALFADRVLRAGGDGYIMKQEDPEEIINAIRDLLAGHIYVSEEVMGGPKTPAKPPANLLEQLTDSELEILELIGHGKTNQQIARQLHLTPKAVAAQCGQIRKKLNLKGANELIRYAACWVIAGPS